MNDSQKNKEDMRHVTQAMQALRSGHKHFVTVSKGRTPRERRHFPYDGRDCRMRYTENHLARGRIGGRFEVEHYRGGKLLDTYAFDNDITDEGLNNILSVAFNGGTQITVWYMGLIDDASFTALDDTDTYDDINQAGNDWDEFTDYTDANNGDSATTRPAWQEDAPSSQSITNGTTKSIYDITAGGTVKGVFLCGGIGAAQTKGDHAPGGTLWATALFSGGDVTVSNGDQLKITYTVNASHA